MKELCTKPFTIYLHDVPEKRKNPKRNSAGERKPTGKLSRQCCLQQYPATANPLASSAACCMFQHILQFVGVLISHFLQCDPVSPLFLSHTGRKAPKEDF